MRQSILLCKVTLTFADSKLNTGARTHSLYTGGVWQSITPKGNATMLYCAQRSTYTVSPIIHVPYTRYTLMRTYTSSRKCIRKMHYAYMYRYICVYLF